MLFLVNHKLCLVYSMYNKYEYVCAVLFCTIQVYSTLYSLQQIVVTYKLQVYIMLIQFTANYILSQVTSLHYVNIVYSKLLSLQVTSLHYVNIVYS